jgi:hypothetical protein
MYQRQRHPSRKEWRELKTEKKTRRKAKSRGSTMSASYKYYAGGRRRAFGRKGEAVVLALENYAAEYGAKAKNLVLKYAEVDYDALPPYEGCG